MYEKFFKNYMTLEDFYKLNEQGCEELKKNA